MMVSVDERMCIRNGCWEGILYGREAMSWCQFQCVCLSGGGGEFWESGDEINLDAGCCVKCLQTVEPRDASWGLIKLVENTKSLCHCIECYAYLGNSTGCKNAAPLLHPKVEPRSVPNVNTRCWSLI